MSALVFFSAIGESLCGIFIFSIVAIMAVK